MKSPAPRAPLFYDMVESGLQSVFDAIAGDGQLWPDFLALCDCGGRLAGSASERAAFALAERLCTKIGPTRVEATSYAGWRLAEARLVLEDGGSELACKPLLGSLSTPAGGMTAEVLDLGAGFGEPSSNVRHILTAGDTRDKITAAELVSAGRLAAALAWHALSAAPETLRALR